MGQNGAIGPRPELLTTAAAGDLRAAARRQWERAARTWEPGRPFVLFDEAVRVLTATMLPWARIPAGSHDMSRPAVAVAWFVAFASAAPALQPHWRERIAAEDEVALTTFAQEVRRRYPPVPATLVPQGGGALRTGHRCPGEDVTLALLEEAVRRLALTRLELPGQDLTVDLARVPTRPRSGVLVSVIP